MSDVVPVLNEEITLKFQNNMMRDRRVARIMQKIQNGTAELIDGHDYAQSLGECLSNALRTTLTEDNLPDGVMYFNIADRTVKPALIVNYDLVNANAAEIQSIVDSGIGLKAVKADFPEARVNGLIDKICDNGLQWLGEAIINNTEAFFDDYIRANAEARSEAGLSVKIIRTAAHKCCAWCASKAGSYEYDRYKLDEMQIFARHEFCRCAVTYQDGKTRQNVWTKTKWQATPAELQQRKDIRGRPVMSKQERQSVIENGEKDRLKQKLRDAGFSSLEADSIYKQALRRKQQWQRATAKDVDNGILETYIDGRIKKKRIAETKKLGG